MSNLSNNNDEQPKVLTIAEFTEKVKKFNILRDLGMVNEEELEAFKQKMLDDYKRTGIK